jgi:hypothetical protein
MYLTILVGELPINVYLGIQNDNAIIYNIELLFCMLLVVLYYNLCTYIYV